MMPPLPFDRPCDRRQDFNDARWLQLMAQWGVPEPVNSTGVGAPSDKIAFWSIMLIGAIDRLVLLFGFGS